MSDEQGQVEEGPQQAEQAQAQQPPVRVAIDLTDTGGEGFAMHLAYFPDGVFDPTSPSHQAAIAIQEHLNYLQRLGQEHARKQEQGMIMRSVLAVTGPVAGPLETLQGPSEATN